MDIATIKLVFIDARIVFLAAQLLKRSTKMELMDVLISVVLC